MKYSLLSYVETHEIFLFRLFRYSSWASIWSKISKLYSKPFLHKLYFDRFKHRSILLGHFIKSQISLIDIKYEN